MRVTVVPLLKERLEVVREPPLVLADGHAAVAPPQVQHHLRARHRQPRRAQQALVVVDDVAAERPAQLIKEL